MILLCDVSKWWIRLVTDLTHFSILVAPLNSMAGTSVDDDEKYQCYRCNRYKGGGTGCPETKRQMPGGKL